MEKHPSRFEQLFLPQLDAAYRLARLLVKQDHDAQDVVQDAYVRALKGFKQFRGGDPRAWILTIVRNTAYSWLEKHPASADMSRLTKRFITDRQRNPHPRGSTKSGSAGFTRHWPSCRSNTGKSWCFVRSKAGPISNWLRASNSRQAQSCPGLIELACACGRKSENA